MEITVVQKQNKSSFNINFNKGSIAVRYSFGHYSTINLEKHCCSTGRWSGQRVASGFFSFFLFIYFSTTHINPPSASIRRQPHQCIVMRRLSQASHRTFPIDLCSCLLIGYHLQVPVLPPLASPSSLHPHSFPIAPPPPPQHPANTTTLQWRHALSPLSTSA